jgi:hypothetical protein
MSEDILVRNSSPTLAGIKTGSLFSCPFVSSRQMQMCVGEWNCSLSGKGIRVVNLRFSEGRSLVYVFRPRQLARDLAKPEAAALLSPRGYNTTSPKKCLLRLKQRINAGGGFPHEIGLFLGYPPADVDGFIRDSRGYQFSGIWKVYGNVAKTKALFARYKECTQDLCAKLNSGCPITELAAAEE